MEESSIVQQRINMSQHPTCCCCVQDSSNRRITKNHTICTTIESNCQMRDKIDSNKSNGRCRSFGCVGCAVSVRTNKTTIYRNLRGKKFGEQRKKRKTSSIIITPKSHTYVNFSKIFYQYSLVLLSLLLLLSNSLEFNKIIGHLAQATNAHININNNNNNKNLILFNNDDESSPSYFRHTITNDNLKNQTPTDDLSDTYTQIPAEYNGEAPTTTITTPTATSTTTRKPNNLDGDKKPLLRLTETELLPFADFNVQQPAFTDLIRVWPPTTISSQQYGPHSSSYDSHLKSSRRHARQQQNLQQKQRQHHHNSGQKSIPDDLDDEGLNEEERMMKNHLNEDLDDTIVTADQSFELDQLPEPPTWVNYLGDLGDYLYVQLRQHSDKTSSSSSTNNKEESSATSETTDNDDDHQNQRKPVNSNQQQLKLETIDEILDDYYYDQYENSQVLYYGAQLVREGDILEIGCYLPSDQQAEWTKSGRPLKYSKSSSPRVVRRGDFLGAKQNFSLKIFEASLSDSGNYRCNKLSRKYHKLVVVPLKTSTAQLYMIQQRLLSIVNPQLMSQTPPSTYGLPPISRFSSPTIGGNQVQRFHSATTLNQIKQFHNQSQKSRDTSYMLPGYLIVENQPLIVNCNITDEFILRRLRENPKFQLSWFKNGRQIVSPAHSANHQSASSYNNVMQAKQLASSSGSQLGRRSGSLRTANSSPPKGEYVSPNPSFGSYRVQFLQANGRQLYITSAMFSDAGEYLCSWAKLPLTRVQPTNGDSSGDENGSGSDFYSSNGAVISGGNDESNLMAAGNLVQLMAPVKLRPFKSAYHVRQGSQLRLICHAQRGYPSAHISWYVGNRLVDSEFLKQHPNEFRILHLQNQNQLTVTSSPASSNGSPNETNDDGKRKLVEINPIPSTRQQMQMTTNGRGQWIEYRDLKNEKYAIDNYEQQLRYLQTKLAQLNGQSSFRSSDSTGTTNTGSNPQPDQTLGVSKQSSISVLVINSLNIEHHTSRFSCRATTRANTDEVTTVIRVQESSTIPVRPSTGKATLIPGQPLHFQCELLGNPRAEFYWFRRPLNDGREIILEPGNDDNIEIHNDRLTLHKATRDLVGDYFCRALEDDKSSTNPKEWAVIKARMQPYIADFGLDTSHTGKSSVITEGERMELTCSVPDHSAPVNITWLRSSTPDDERSMVKLAEVSPAALTTTPSAMADPFAQTFTAPDQNIMIEKVDTHSKKLIIESIRHEHRGHYVCMADNGITERTRKIIFIRVKDKLVALWPFLGIVAELFILFTIIHIWETQRAYKEVRSAPPSVATAIAGHGAVVAVTASNKRPAVGASAGFENVPLTSG